MSTKEEKSLSFPLSSLPDDLVLSCIARLSRSDYAALSLVSKRYHSLVVSHELYKTRSLLGYTKNRLYVCLQNGYSSTLFWFTLSRENATSWVMKPIHSFPSHPQPSTGSSVVVLDMGIYVIGGWRKRRPASSDVLLLDFWTHKWRHVPSMSVRRAYAAAGVVDGKIYVFGGCSKVDCLNWGEVFDPKTQTWDTLVPMPYIDIRLEWMNNDWCRKRTRSHCLGYSPSEGKLGRRNLDWTPYLKKHRQMVMIDKLLYCWDDSKKLLWCAKEDFKWKKVKGLDLKELSGFQKLSNFGENIVVFWRMTACSKIWCTEISLERREKGDEIWGKVEWSDALNILDHPLSLGETVLHTISLNI